jgi:hypothetical protein
MAEPVEDVSALHVKKRCENTPVNYTQIVCSCSEEMSYGSLEEEATAVL